MPEHLQFDEEFEETTCTCVTLTIFVLDQQKNVQKGFHFDRKACTDRQMARVVCSIFLEFVLQAESGKGHVQPDHAISSNSHCTKKVDGKPQDCTA